MQYADAVAAWEEDEYTYILRNTKDGGIANASFVDSSDELRLVHVGGSSSAVWTIGREAFCKVKAWSPEMELTMLSPSSQLPITGQYSSPHASPILENLGTQQ